MAVEAAWLCFLFPLIGALLSPLLGKIHPKLRDYGAVFCSFLAAAISVSFIPYLFQPSSLPMETSFLWLTAPFTVRVGVLVDPLSIVMSNVVAVISFIIMVYSLGYMKGDPSLTRFWIWMNLFIGSMLLLVLSNNLLFIFIGWKLVGLCSYGLIGFYHQDEKKYWIGGPPPIEYCTPSHAGLKALVVTSLGDLFMLAGILILFFYSKTLSLSEIYETSSVWFPEMAKSPGIIVLLSVFLLAGPLGKSAQFPFQEWLPEAMAGPGPVSALIHAATMVKSGVYLVARLFPIFYYGYWGAGCGEAKYFFLLTAGVGVFTAFLAATQGIVSVELKKALAYSTISQIGYMMLAIGIAGLDPSLLVKVFTAGTYHLLNHALFKACLFLCAGSVIHAVHSIYMRDMGSLRKFMPFTFVFMSFAALSLMGVPPLSGFWSKDAILVACLESHNYGLIIVALATVVLTTFYTTRFMGLVFYGRKSEHIEQLEKQGGRLREAPWTMAGACGILALMIVLLSIFSLSFEHLLGKGFDYALTKKFSLPATSPEPHSISHSLAPILSILSLGLGFLPAYFLYIRCKSDPAALLERHTILRVVHKFLVERWYMNRLYYRFFASGVMKLSASVPGLIEDPLDRLFHNYIPSIPEGLYTMGSYVLGHRRKDGLAKGTPPEASATGTRLGFALFLALLFVAAYLIILLIRVGS
jgi:NADH-quinone oxidoreductase subunit L